MGMSNTRHVVLIHGYWSRGEQLAGARAAFEQRGYTAHTPTLRCHDLPPREGATKIASLSLRDYTDDLVKFVDSLDSPPLLVGHSMGGLLAPFSALFGVKVCWCWMLLLCLVFQAMVVECRGGRG